MVQRKSSHSSSSSSSSGYSSAASPASALTDDWDADDEPTMPAEDFQPSRPLSVAIPKSSPITGPYCPRRPGLRDILANTSAAPWTLAAFMAYLSNNHCLETLEFTMDAGRYRKHYQKMMARAVASGGIPPSTDREYVHALWQRLVDAYIRSNGSREVNLPSDVRNPILNLVITALPPAPELLDPAVAKIYELMEESVLVPFLNSVWPQSAHPAVSTWAYDSSAVNMSASARPNDTQTALARRNRNAWSSPPPQSAVEPYAHSYTAGATLNRKTSPSTAPGSLNKARYSVKLSPTTSSPTAHMSTLHGVDSASGSVTTEGSASTDSLTNDSPMTPPASPPMSDASSKRDSGMWKKLGRLGGGKKKSHGGSREEQ